MYRWFLILAFFNFGESVDVVSQTICRGNLSRYCRPSKARQYGPPHNYYHGNGQTETGTPSKPSVQPLPPANTFEELAQNLAAAESAVRAYCRNNSNGIVNEVFGVDSYILKYNLPDYKESAIQVKIKHGVIEVTANQASLTSFKDLRLLPSIVNTRLAWWELANNFLKIVLPYNVALRKESVNKCGDVNEAIIEVPSMKFNNLLQYRTFEEEEITTEKKVQTSTSTEPDTMSVDDAMAIIFPDSV